jgi:hypothetical protein
MRDEELELVDLAFDAAEAGISRDQFKDSMRKAVEDGGGETA